MQTNDINAKQQHLVIKKLTNIIFSKERPNFISNTNVLALLNSKNKSFKTMFSL